MDLGANFSWKFTNEQLQEVYFLSFEHSELDGK